MVWQICEVRPMRYLWCVLPVWRNLSQANWLGWEFDVPGRRKVVSRAS